MSVFNIVSLFLTWINKVTIYSTKLLFSLRFLVLQHKKNSIPITYDKVVWIYVGGDVIHGFPYLIYAFGNTFMSDDVYSWWQV